MSAPDNVLPFRRSTDRLVYAPGVMPFDRTNPAHVEAWNALFAYGRAQRSLQDSGAS